MFQHFLDKAFRLTNPEIPKHISTVRVSYDFQPDDFFFFKSRSVQKVISSMIKEKRFFHQDLGYSPHVLLNSTPLVRGLCNVGITS